MNDLNVGDQSYPVVLVRGHRLRSDVEQLLLMCGFTIRQADWPAYRICSAVINTEAIIDESD